MTADLECNTYKYRHWDKLCALDADDPSDSFVSILDDRIVCGCVMPYMSLGEKRIGIEKDGGQPIAICTARVDTD